jgi:hypothetical protein
LGIIVVIRASGKTAGNPTNLEQKEPNSSDELHVSLFFPSLAEEHLGLSEKGSGYYSL